MVMEEQSQVAYPSENRPKVIGMVRHTYGKSGEGPVTTYRIVAAHYRLVVEMQQTDTMGQPMWIRISSDGGMIPALEAFVLLRLGEPASKGWMLMEHALPSVPQWR